MHMSSRLFCLPCNWIYLIQNPFLSYVYLKDIHKTLKEIGKIQFVSELRILLNLYISKFHESLPKEKIWNCQNLLSKVNFSKIHPTNITIYIKMDFAVNDKLWALKFNKFSHFQNAISNNSPTRERYYDPLSTKIDMCITPNLI